jgi:DNA repair exonuclease SbcCD ATPase subunit
VTPSPTSPEPGDDWKEGLRLLGQIIWKPDGNGGYVPISEEEEAAMTTSPSDTPQTNSLIADLRERNSDSAYELAELARTLERSLAQAVRERNTYQEIVRDTCADMECLPGCDSWGHEELCPVTNPQAAWRDLRSRLTAAEQKIALYAACMNTGGADELHARLSAAEQRAGENERQIAEARKEYAALCACLGDEVVPGSTVEMHIRNVDEALKGES